MTSFVLESTLNIYKLKAMLVILKQLYNQNKF